MADVCINCQKPKANLKCGICGTSVCKKCAQFVEEDHFMLMPQVPDELAKGRYCPPCFDEKISPALSAYDALIARAKQVIIFHPEDAAETRLFQRENKPVTVENCADNSDVLMKLAYMAVEAGCNTLIDVQVTSEKVDISGYQTSKWKGKGLPVKLDGFVPNRKRRIMGRGPG
ncbi:MAG: hypothetical protein ABL958_17910 [Bdellovibrionia bacterium]